MYADTRQYLISSSSRLVWVTSALFARCHDRRVNYCLRVAPTTLIALTFHLKPFFSTQTQKATSLPQKAASNTARHDLFRHVTHHTCSRIIVLSSIDRMCKRRPGRAIWTVLSYLYVIDLAHYRQVRTSWIQKIPRTPDLNFRKWSVDS